MIFTPNSKIRCSVFLLFLHKTSLYEKSFYLIPRPYDSKPFTGSREIRHALGASSRLCGKQNGAQKESNRRIEFRLLFLSMIFR